MQPRLALVQSQTRPSTSYLHIVHSENACTVRLPHDLNTVHALALATFWCPQRALGMGSACVTDARTNAWHSSPGSDHVTDRVQRAKSTLRTTRRQTPCNALHAVPMNTQRGALRPQCCSNAPWWVTASRLRRVAGRCQLTSKEAFYPPIMVGNRSRNACTGVAGICYPVATTNTDNRHDLRCTEAG